MPPFKNSNYGDVHHKKSKSRDTATTPSSYIQLMDTRHKQVHDSESPESHHRMASNAMTHLATPHLLETPQMH